MMGRGLSVQQWKILKVLARHLWDWRTWKWRAPDDIVSWTSVDQIAEEVCLPDKFDPESGDPDWRDTRKPTRSQYVSVARAVQSLEKRGLVESETSSYILDIAAEFP